MIAHRMGFPGDRRVHRREERVRDGLLMNVRRVAHEWGMGGARGEKEMKRGELIYVGIWIK